MVFSFDFLPGLGEALERRERANIVTEEKEKQGAAGCEQLYRHRLGNWEPSGVNPH